MAAYGFHPPLFPALELDVAIWQVCIHRCQEVWNPPVSSSLTHHSTTVTWLTYVTSPLINTNKDRRCGFKEAHLGLHTSGLLPWVSSITRWGARRHPLEGGTGMIMDPILFFGCWLCVWVSCRGCAWHLISLKSFKPFPCLGRHFWVTYRNHNTCTVVPLFSYIRLLLHLLFVQLNLLAPSDYALLHVLL